MAKEFGRNARANGAVVGGRGAELGKASGGCNGLEFDLCIKGYACTDFLASFTTRAGEAIDARPCGVRT